MRRHLQQVHHSSHELSKSKISSIPDFDPEDVQVTDIDDSTENLGARAHYVDVGPSALRKLHDSVADPKYDGRRMTRKQLLESDEDDGLSNEEEKDEDDDGNSPSRKESGDDNNSQLEQVREPSIISFAEESELPEDLSSTLWKTREEDRKKGKAVVRQLAIWDSLLDARIRLQKSVTAANRLPTPFDMSRFTTSTEGSQALNKMLEEAMSASNEIFELQEGFLISNESLQPPPRKKRRIQPIEDERPQDYASQIQEASQAASTLQHIIHPHLIQIVTKWSFKVQSVAPSVLLPSTHGTFSKKSTHGMKSAIQLIDDTLRFADYDKIFLARTQARKGRRARIGKEDQADDEEKEDDADVEIFDDTDFYQQLLRDVIDARGTGVGADDWIIIQKQKKAKKKVDTRASKGRKLRYEIHEKLQNFMVPVPIQGGWHEEQIDELFASLLGKSFEDAATIYGADVNGGESHTEAEKKQEVELGEALKGGFRVFG